MPACVARLQEVAALAAQRSASSSMQCVLTQERIAEILALAGFVLVVLGFVTGPQVVCIQEPCPQALNVPVLAAGLAILVFAIVWTVALRLRKP